MDKLAESLGPTFFDGPIGLLQPSREIYDTRKAFSRSIMALVVARGGGPSFGEAPMHAATHKIPN